MTIEEAIKQLRSLKTDRESFFEADNDDDKAYREDAEACETGIKALEKQMPKRPDKINRYKGVDIPTGKCAICHNNVYGSGYCRHCGQALDWGDP